MKKSVFALAAVLTLVFFTAYADCCKAEGDACCKTEGKKYCAPAKTASKEPTEQDVVIDPVCGMDVKASEAKYKYEYKGKTYRFCSKSCLNSFKKDPSKFIGKEKK